MGEARILREAVIVDAVRSPMAKGNGPKNGKPGGALSTLHPVELLGQTLQGLVDRNDFDPAEVDDVIIGCVSQVGEQAGPVGRWAWLAAGLPEHVPSTTIDRRCGSSQQAADFAAMGVMTGTYDIVVAGGVESMSRVPMGTARIGQDFAGPSVTERYAPGLVPQGISADIIAARFGLDRHALDVFSARSHQAAAATDYSEEIVPITVTGEDGCETVIDRDQTIRPQTTVEKLAELRPVFQSEEMSKRFPDINWSITAGNSSQLTDGAAVLLIMSVERADQLGLKPRARIHAFAVASDDPITMLTGPIPATEKVLRKSGMTIDEFDHIEVNEAFAPVPLAWRQHFDADIDKINPRGGAIALGAPARRLGGEVDGQHARRPGGLRRTLGIADHVRGRRDGQRDNHRTRLTRSATASSDHAREGGGL